MAQSSSDIISITVSQVVAALLLPGFGVPLILSAHTNYPDRVRYYTANAAGLAQMITDGFAATSSTYLAASAITAQNPAPQKFGIGRINNVPTQQYTLTPTPIDSTVYRFLFNGNVVTFTSGVGTTAALITAGLKTAFDAFAMPWTSTSGATLTLTANAAGTYGKIQIQDANGNTTSTGRANLSCGQTHADPGVATDLAAINAYDNGWYWVGNQFDSKLMALAVAAWVESNQKLYIVGSVDDQILTNSITDVASTIKTSAYTRTACMYKSENTSFAQFAWAGKVLPLVAGSENWAYKTLAGVPADTLSEAEIGNACGIPTAGTVGKYASIYSTIFGVNVTQFGRVGSGSWLDITRGLDALIVEIGSRIYTDLSGANKVPYSDTGIAVIEKDIRGALIKYQSPPQNFLAIDPPVQVVTPLASTLTPAQRSARLLPNVTFQANLAGALNGTTISGVVIP